MCLQRDVNLPFHESPGSFVVGYQRQFHGKVDPPNNFATT